MPGSPDAHDAATAGARRAWPNIGAYAVVHGDEPQFFLAEDEQVIARALALHLVAQLPAATVSSSGRLEEMRKALLEERWADALVAWMEETGRTVDVFAEPPPIYSIADLDLDKASLEIRVSPLFSES